MQQEKIKAALAPDYAGSAQFTLETGVFKLPDELAFKALQVKGTFDGATLSIKFSAGGDADWRDYPKDQTEAPFYFQDITASGIYVLSPVLSGNVKVVATGVTRNTDIDITFTSQNV